MWVHYLKNLVRHCTHLYIYIWPESSEGRWGARRKQAGQTRHSVLQELKAFINFPILGPWCMHHVECVPFTWAARRHAATDKSFIQIYFFPSFGLVEIQCPLGNEKHFVGTLAHVSIDTLDWYPHRHLDQYSFDIPEINQAREKGNLLKILTYENLFF